MATTTNYGWTTPDDTALVKDGAAAIRTLGSSVDTTTKALNPSTTLGDIEYRSSTANTNTRLPIGTTGQLLTVAGGVPSWAAAPASGSLTLLSTTTLSGTSTTVSSISQSYKNLLVVLTNVYSSASDYAVTVQFNSDGSNHAFARFGMYNGAINSGYDTGTSYAEIGRAGSSSTSTHSFIGMLTVYRYTETTTRTFSSNYYSRPNGANYYGGTSNGKYVGGSAISSITFAAEGNSFSGGTAFIYGVN